MMSSNSTTFFVSLPSNVKDYSANRPNNFRVHLPKSLQFDGNWGCALQSIHFPYTWSPGVGIESGQWIEIHSETDSPIRIPIPENSFDSTQECVAFLNDLIAANISQIKRSRKRRNAESEGEERSLFHTTLDRLRGEVDPDPPPPKVPDEIPFESDTVRAPDPPPPLEEQEEIRKREEAARAEAVRAEATKKKEEEEKKKKEEDKKKRDEEDKKKREQEATRAIAVRAEAVRTERKEAAKKKDEEAKKRDEEDKKKKEEEEKKKRDEASKAKESTSTPPDPPKEEEEARSLAHTTLDRLRNRDPSPPRVADEVPFESDKVRAPDPPPPLDETNEERSMAHTFIDRLRGDNADAATTTAVEAYEEPKSKEKGIIKELLDTMTMDLTAEELRSSDAQIQARIDQQEYERMGPAPTQLEEKAPKEAPTPEEEERSMAHTFLDRLRGINNSSPPAEKFIEFKYLEANDRISLDFSANVSYVSLSPQLNEVLGIFVDSNHLSKGSSTQKGADFSRGISAFAVCAKDLTEPMILGNQTHSLLRIVSVDGHHKPGMFVEKNYDSPMFMRVLPREINEIEIEIRTLSGRFVPFIYGTVIVTLIFKKLIKY